MIDLVYKTVTRTETRLVTKTKPKKKRVKVSPEKYSCGRCGNSFLPGANKQDPEKCPHCVCVQCGRSLMDRPRHHTLCGYCWGMHSLGRSYSFPIEHIKAVYEYRDVAEEVQVEESFSVEENQLIDISNIEYNRHSRICTRTYSIETLWKFLLEDKDVSAFDKWYGVKNINETLNLLNKKASFAEIDTSQLRPIEPNYSIVDERQELVEFHDVVGFYPDVPAYIMGHPLNMFNNIRRNVQEVEKHLTIWFNTAIDSKYSKTIYKYKGIAAFTLWEYSHNQGISTDIQLIDASFIESETLLLKTSLSDEWITENRDLTYRMLTEVAFLRVTLKKIKELLVSLHSISETWSEGFGFAISDKDLKKIIDMEDNDLLISDVEAMGIKGRRINDDFQAVMRYLKLLDA